MAGPVVAAACCLPGEVLIAGVDDSKKLSPLKREELFQIITKHEKVSYGLGVVTAAEIDQINILQAAIKAMQLALSQLSIQPDLLLVDGMKIDYSGIPCQKIIGGDALSFLIACASIIAKVTRDRIMLEYHKKWPEYGFDQHKGYGTEKHVKALKEHGPCEIHRLTFEPIKSGPVA